MKLNNDAGMPSIRGVDYNINKFKPKIIEGALRCTELLAYMKASNLPLYVSLSEDATNITGMVEYCTEFNQIVGLILPLREENAMPVPSSYAATSAAAIEVIMSDRNIPIANMLNVVMAQPFVSNTPAFCLLVYGGNGKFTRENVAKRWEYIVNELRNIGIKVVSISSDSDTRYNSAMKELMLSCKTDGSSVFPRWFHFDCSTAIYFPFQDTVHIGTKLRNKFLNGNMLFGRYTISVEHLHILMRNVGRDKHGIYKTHINKTDKMNFISVQRITHPKVTQLLKKHVSESDGTIMYLRIIDRAFLDMSLSPLERIRNMWYATFILRIWRESVLQNPDQQMKNHFITSYSYTCIEINAHSLVTLMLYLKANELSHLFLPHLVSSQPCEAFFRDFRSLSTSGSTVTNCSVLGSIHRCEKLDLMNNIARNNLKDFTFATKSTRSREIYYNTTKYNTTMLPTREEIIDVIEIAREDAMKDATALGVEIEQQFDYMTKITPPVYKPQELQKLTCSRIDGNKLTQFQALHLTDFSDKIDFNKFNERSPYVAIDDAQLDGIGDRRIYARKDDLISLYMERCTKLSSDRIKRVQQPGQWEKTYEDPVQSDLVAELPEIFFPELFDM